MKIFKGAIDKELHQPYPNRKDLLYKTCIRLSLVKEEQHPLKNPCWFMIVNLVAMDMLNAKVPFLANSKLVIYTFLKVSHLLFWLLCLLQNICVENIPGI